MGLCVLLPQKDTRYIVTYSETSCEVQVFEIKLRRLIRRFKLCNPEYSREQEELEAKREQEKKEILERKMREKEAKRLAKLEKGDDSEEEAESAEEEEEDSEDNEDADDKQPKKKAKKKEEVKKEKPRPYLALKIEQIQAIEISPKANYIVLVYSNRVIVVRITPHEDLATLTLPIYMIKNLSFYNPIQKQ